MAQTPPEGPDDRVRPSGAPGREPSVQGWAQQGSGQPPYRQPPHGQAPHGQPPYGQAPYGQAPYGQPPYGQPALGPQPERRNTWLVPAIIGLGIVLVVGAVVFVLTRSGAGMTTADPGAPGVSAPATEPATAPTDGATAGATPDEAAVTAPPTADARQVSGEPLEPRVDGEIVGTNFVLSDAGWAEHAAGLAAGAREAVAGTYTNGSVDVPVTAAAFDTIGAQDAYSEQLTASLREDGAQLLSDGPVYPDSTGHHWAFMLADGVTTTVVWRTDDGVVLTLTGDPDAVPEIYSNMLI
jgi:hypothetical protein